MSSLKPLRLLCLTTSFPNSPSDYAGFFVYQLADAIAREGARVIVLTPQSNQRSDTWLLPYSVHRFSYAPLKWQVLAQRPGGIPAALTQSWKNYLLFPSFLLSFMRNIVLLGRKVDLILANWAVCGALASHLAPLHRRPIVTVLRGSDVKNADDAATYSYFLKRSLKGSKAVVCVGKDQETRLKKATMYQEKIHHIPNGVHEAFFSVKPLEPAHKVNILFAGSLIPRKGVDVLLQAIAKLRSSRIHLFIVGEGPLEMELKGLAKNLNIERSLTFVGRVPPGAPMAGMMARAHFLVLPSHHEGRPNVVLEAMAAGRPVIGSDIKSIRELIKPAETGYLFPDGDADGLSSAIVKMMENPRDLFKMGRSARDWVTQQELTWKHTAGEYIRLFQGSMGS